ncbi:aspartyl-phosphate phosphatase Spo0E family protein [Gorillibacterium sp. sgz5001074]|uniref:aspartyl-phosphate phosphatase Spo0E family protein n=1 Tax=Gorillibacterium sp. sgz5001074 TaxID=3446695 RepID=UPI003F672AB0
MAFAEYVCRSYRGSMLVRDPNHSTKWAYRLSSKPSPSASLEEEIYSLRKKMEQLALKEQCLTAPKVVEISTILDKKLNEYMGIFQRA